MQILHSGSPWTAIHLDSTLCDQTKARDGIDVHVSLLDTVFNRAAALACIYAEDLSGIVTIAVSKRATDFDLGNLTGFISRIGIKARVYVPHAFPRAKGPNTVFTMDCGLPPTKHSRPTIMSYRRVLRQTGPILGFVTGDR